MVQRALEIISREHATAPSAIPYLEAVREITEGKIFLEVEKATATQMLSNILLEAGDAKKAMEYLLELPVETFATMDKQQKTKLLLEQLKLALSQKEIVKATIVIKKINPKIFEVAEFAPLKADFYVLKTLLSIFNDEHLAAAEGFLVLAEVIEHKACLCYNNAVIYCCLARFDCKQQELLQRLHKMKEIAKWSPIAAEICALFCTHEMISYAAFKHTHGHFVDANALDDAAFGAIVPSNAIPDRAAAFTTRIFEHNIRIVARFYAEIHLKRLGELLGCTTDAELASVEDLLCKMVCDRAVYARINRPAGIVSFAPRLSTDEVLDVWSAKRSELLQLIVDTGHLIAKEQMLTLKNK